MSVDIETEAIISEMKECLKKRKEFEATASPAPEIPESVLNAMEQPLVKEKRNALLNYINEVTNNALFPTNYYDKVMIMAISHVAKKIKQDENDNDNMENITIIVKIINLYLDFIDSLLPYQLPKDVVEYSSALPKMPFESPEPEPGSVFYHIQSCGGYWVAGRDGIEKQFAPLLEAYKMFKDI